MTSRPGETVLSLSVSGVKKEPSVSIVFPGFIGKMALQSKFDKQLHFSIQCNKNEKKNLSARTDLD